MKTLVVFDLLYKGNVSSRNNHIDSALDEVLDHYNNDNIISKLEVIVNGNERKFTILFECQCQHSKMKEINAYTMKALIKNNIEIIENTMLSK